MIKKTDRILLFQLLMSFFTTWALMKASRMEPGNILTFVFFLLTFFFYRHVNRRMALFSISNRLSAAAAVFFSFLYMVVDYPHYIELLTSSLYRAVVLAVVFLGFVFLFYNLLLFLFSYTCNKDLLARTLLSDYAPASYIHPKHPRLSAAFTAIFRFYREHTALCAFLLCMLCWLPYYLYQYPGIMTPDSINQFEQVLGLVPWSNHHPWMHTLVFGLFYRIGYALTGDMAAAVSVYTFFQMCLLAGSIAYFISTLRACRIRPFVLLLITAFYALIPYHAVFSVTIWKDIPFAAAALLFGCALLRLSVFGSVNAKNLIVFTISGVMICLFRSNGWYGFLLALPFLLFGFRNKAKRIYPLLLAILLCAVVVKYPVMRAFRVEQPDFIESVSIPMQQITAVICNDRELRPEERALIEKVVDLTYIRDLYNPGFADNIKELVRAGDQDYLVTHKQEFFKLWFRLGLRYPGDYLRAYINQTYGYWYPDSFYLVAEAEGVSATDLGVSHRPLIGGPLVVKGKEIAIKLGGMVPIYGTLWSMGVACWILLFSICTVIIRGEAEKLICYLPSVTLLLTVLIATPVAAEFRYVYFMVLSLPFYLITAMLQEKG
ncbi:MAG: DUF6020 family protein [Bacteroidales bacterium]|nr:DUF6020 family protein [Bacteroidales bacterium]MCM1415839.1 DUF6020 family protein [bacterium]MCM1423584.1 DUF6020 family protein [bacterium]